MNNAYFNEWFDMVKKNPELIKMEEPLPEEEKKRLLNLIKNKKPSNYPPAEIPISLKRIFKRNQG